MTTGSFLHHNTRVPTCQRFLRVRDRIGGPLALDSGRGANMDAEPNQNPERPRAGCRVLRARR